jgi:hypothetical protein
MMYAILVLLERIYCNNFINTGVICELLGKPGNWDLQMIDLLRIINHPSSGIEFNNYL